MNAPSLNAMHSSLIDSHWHLSDPVFFEEPLDFKKLDPFFKKIGQSGVKGLVTIATETSSIALLEKISAHYHSIYHTVGVHPHHVSAMSDEDLLILEKASQHSHCRAIGEIGLDYARRSLESKSSCSFQLQQTRLEQQLDIAIRMKQPVVIHSRDAEEDLYLALKQYCLKLSGGQIPGVIHCFSGTLDFGKKCLDLGFYLSFSGILTFKNAEQVREAARSFPLSRLLVETDAPYLAPVPFRGKKCEPWMVRLTAEKLAEVQGVDFEEVASVTTQNACHVFRMQVQEPSLGWNL